MPEKPVQLEGTTVLADMNCFCEDNLKAAAEKNIESIIADNQFRKSKASDCKNCPYTAKCFQRKKSVRGIRTLYNVDSKGSVNYSQVMIEEIDRPELRELYSK